MSEERNWREAKMPQWARDGVQAEIDQWRLTAALSWPTEAKPAPLPFRWGEYDRLHGDPIPGEYWVPMHDWYVSRVEIREAKDLPDEARRTASITAWKKWAFATDGGRWSTGVVRGPIFATERDARLYQLWDASEDCARKLLALRNKMDAQ